MSGKRFGYTSGKCIGEGFSNVLGNLGAQIPQKFHFHERVTNREHVPKKCTGEAKEGANAVVPTQNKGSTQGPYGGAPNTTAWAVSSWGISIKCVWQHENEIKLMQGNSRSSRLFIHIKNEQITVLKSGAGSCAKEISRSPRPPMPTSFILFYQTCYLMPFMKAITELFIAYQFGDFGFLLCLSITVWKYHSLGLS